MSDAVAYFYSVIPSCPFNRIDAKRTHMCTYIFAKQQENGEGWAMNDSNNVLTFGLFSNPLHDGCTVAIYI